ncbi:kinase-like protein [Exidia glandulosa HHB12029]|uniref:mitogen-activated protein kinase kinase n=1 Tax=Exidia glandulosa HHB12029 TaxID=1314781 RepID=A0A165C167_EXIGL|nr:kinase-like protein [Exidia glandulosa HHB12029]
MRQGFSDSAAAPGSRASPFNAVRKKPGLKLSDIGGRDSPGDSLMGAGLGAGRPSLDLSERRAPQGEGSLGTPFSNFSKIVDPSGQLNFGGKAVLNASGVNFSTGQSFSINMTELQLEEELGRGNYGTVKKVLHKPTNVAMAMKEIRLELEDSKLNAIIMELDILHRATAPEIVEFYGAFFIESCVYYCMEYMDAGSLDKLQGAGVPEDVLARITASMVRGLKFLKDELQIIHRDVKPTNVLVNRGGLVKLCDFGVSGQLEKSLAKTNIGCQSYMAPERIKGESQNKLGTYTVSSDVWSLGLSMIEIAMGQYPYPPETYSNVFAQLTAIVHGDPPHLPDGFSDDAHAFVDGCLEKEPERRPTYSDLIQHPFLVADQTRDVDMKGWVKRALEYRASASAQAAAAAAPPLHGVSASAD